MTIISLFIFNFQLFYYWKEIFDLNVTIFSILRGNTTKHGTLFDQLTIPTSADGGKEIYNIDMTNSDSLRLIYAYR